MRKLLVVLMVLFVCSVSVSAQVLDGFLGVPFGASLKTVQDEMAKRPGTSLDKPYGALAGLPSISFKGWFDGRRADLQFSFRNEELVGASATIEPLLSEKVSDTFDKLAEKLIAQFGEPNVSNAGRNHKWLLDGPEDTKTYVYLQAMRLPGYERVVIMSGYDAETIAKKYAKPKEPERNLLTDL